MVEQQETRATIVNYAVRWQNACAAEDGQPEAWRGFLAALDAHEAAIRSEPEAERDALNADAERLAAALEEIDQSISKGNGASLIRPVIRAALAAHQEAAHD